MVTRVTRRGVPAAAAWGGVGVLAWAALSVLFGGGSAQASEKDDAPLGGLTSLVSETVSSVTAPVTPVVEKVVAPVVAEVVAPVQRAVPATVSAVTQPVEHAPVVAPVVKTVTETAPRVVAPVTQIVTSSPASKVTAPVLDTVAELPVAGELLTDLGVIATVDTVVDTVDGTAGLIGGLVHDVVPPTIGALTPTNPTLPSDEIPGGEEGQEVVTAIAAVQHPSARSEATRTPDLALHSVDRSFSAAAAPPVTSAASSENRRHTGASGHLPGFPEAPAPASSVAGSGGSSCSPPARVHDAHGSRSLEGSTASPHSDEDLPPYPVADTDVSPD